MLKTILRWSAIAVVTATLCVLLETGLATAMIFMVVGYLINKTGE